MRLTFSLRNKLNLTVGLVFLLTSLNASAQVIAKSPVQTKLQEVKGYVTQYCSACHQVPPTDIVPKKDWPRIVKAMADLAAERMGGEFIPQERVKDITAFYYGSSPTKLPTLPYYDKTPTPLTFELSTLANKSSFPLIVKIQKVQLGIVNGLELLVCDGEKNQLLLLHKDGAQWQEQVLAEIPVPVNTQVIDYDNDGDQDILVAALGYFPPSDILAGKVILLEQTTKGVFTKKVILENVGRVVDAHAIDIDNDGDLDIATAIFGGSQVGEVAWLENTGAGKHIKHTIIKTPGALNVSPMDLNGDGHMDLISLFTQEKEAFIASINDGKGNFKSVKLAQAPHPMFGSTSMTLVDIDKDKDLDILFTNGDNFDLQRDPKPYHGVQWLENKGNFKFEYHDIGRFYGAVNAKGADLDGDGDIDIIASSWSNFWDDKKRQSLIWYENTGQQKFTRHDIISRPISIVPFELVDLDGDKQIDIIAGVFRVAALNEMLMGRESNIEQRTEPRIITLKSSRSP